MSKGKRTDEETQCRHRKEDEKGCRMSEERVGDEGALLVGSVEKGDRGGYGGGSGDDSIDGSGGGDSVGAWRYWFFRGT